MRPFIAEFDVSLEKVQRVWLRRAATVLLIIPTMFLCVLLGMVYGIIDSVVYGWKYFAVECWVGKMSDTIQKNIPLEGGLLLKYYSAQSDHGSRTENYTLFDKDGNFIKLFEQTNLRKPKILCKLLATRKDK